MRRLLNTLYIMQDELHLCKKGETICVYKDNQKQVQLPIHNLESIIVFSDCSITPALMELCFSRTIHISFISRTGRFLVKLQPPMHGNVVLRRAQYKYADIRNERLMIAQWFITGKIYNSKQVLGRLIRDHKEKINYEKVSEVVYRLSLSLKRINKTKDLGELRGIEGEAAKNYFSVFGQLILNTDKDFEFKGRSRRPPLDAVNCLLSFFYTILSHEIEGALESVGLDPQVGYLHMERSGKSSLAFDMIEELRPYIVDRFVITMINNRKVNSKGFIKQDNGAVLLKDDIKRDILNEWQKRKNETITHPFLKEKIEIGLIPYVQSLLLARYIRGDIDAYPTFLMR